MSDKFAAICQITLSFKKHKDKFIRNAVIELLPKLASYSPSLFVSYGHLKESVEYLMETLVSDNKSAKDIAYYSLGGLSLSVQRKIRPYLGDIVKLIKDGLLGYTASNNYKISQFHSALACLSNLVCAVGSDLSSYLKPLIGQMFCSGLSNDLVETLKNICNNIESLQQSIHEQLALEIWNILSMSHPDQPLFDLINDMNNKTYSISNNTKNWISNDINNGGGDQQKDLDEDQQRVQRMRSMTNNRIKSRDKDSLRRGSKYKDSKEKQKKDLIVRDVRLIHLALCALADFELDDVFLLPFIREIASIYLNYDDFIVRKQASLFFLFFFCFFPSQ